MWDANKQIAHITYDNLNYPKEVQFTNGNRIQYVYSPDGRKLRATWQTAVANIVVPLNTTTNLSNSQISSTTRTDYIGNVIYTGTSSSSSASVSLSKYLFEGGYATVTPSTQPVFHYYTQDHLGNNRAVVNQSGTVEQITHYYPFGGFFADQGTGSSLQPYKYNGKELDRMHGLDLYDYGFRQYDPVVPMFTQQDPLAEKYYHLSSYVYCANNPVNAIDPTGMDIWDVDTEGNITNNVKTEDYDMIRIINKNGKYSASVKFNYGTVYHQSLEDSNGKGYELFKISGDDNGRNAFEMLAQDTDVEWTKGVIGESESTNIITTSHKTSEESGFASYISNNFKEGMVIKDITHNHPSGSAFPSFGKTRGDVAFARYIEELTGQKPTFHIYSLNDGRYQYVKYGPNSTINDFILNGASINEIIVYGRKNKR